MTYDMTELQRERSMGAVGTESDREVRRISMAGLPGRRTEVADELWSAATDIGFFQVVDHGIDLAEVRRAFAMAEAFFALPTEAKARYPKRFNSGWESLTQIRPSVGTPDQKESYQVTLSNMDDLWPGDDVLAGFTSTILEFEHKCWALAMELLSMFADKLGFDREFFTRAHEPTSPGYQSTLRLLHYFAVAPDADLGGMWRAGAHTDFDCLTLLFQREGQGGLQVCPGKEMESQVWTSVQPSDDAITCNIGDMLMRWSDDDLPSNFHRVRSPGPNDDRGSRYSIAFFAQANKDVLIEGPRAKYPPISAEDYLRQRIAANFAK
ncbi:isopenicillin N synthase family oxygenase [Nocardia sp. 348MFTsu5.1]|uniref:isopenicillin N synthase family dioxygenase n=1 Tax=Nocardia sp. 348MFTsu5.1 TaxID=1172185 RepID=UPI000374CBA6|nr:2OG-Fe(II) oxygenase family protein [Nocardia sp. 348MFTsu5.1]